MKTKIRKMITKQAKQAIILVKKEKASFFWSSR
jgi:hypothetical protein